MYRSELNMKHRNRSHLFWGLNKDTNEVVYISQVKNRGLECNCRCAHCGEDFVAKLGDINKHHFAHKSNYECVYSNEIAIYLLTKKLLEQIQTISVPAISVLFGYRRDIVTDNHNVTIGKTFYQCESQQYPPLLVANLNDQPTRIVLSFEKYYSTEDFLLLRNEARDKGWNCLIIDLPRIVDESSISLALLKVALKGCIEDKRWIYHLEADKAQKKLSENAITPPAVMPKTFGTTYECPLHRQNRDGKYYAVISDCDGCPYNLAEYPACKCLAHIGVQKYQDFSIPLEKRMEKVNTLRTANEMRLKLIQQQAERRAAARPVAPGFYHTKPLYTAHASRGYTMEEKIALGRKEMEEKFDPKSNELAYDSFGRRWVQCTKCLRIVPSEDCPMYGGRNGVNLGICYDCSRK